MASSKPFSQIDAIAYDRIARRIGVRLREVYAHPETEALPVEHVDLLLKLRHKERERISKAR